MADVRALLKAKRQEARITHPYAAYGANGALRCTACGVPVKFASAWEGHLGSKSHRVAVTNLKAKQEEESEWVAATASSKRKAEEEAEEEEGDDGGDGGGDGGDVGLDGRMEVETVTESSSRPRPGKRQRTEEREVEARKAHGGAPASSSSSHSFPMDFFSDPARAIPLQGQRDGDDEDDEDDKMDEDGKKEETRTTGPPKSQFDMEWDAFERDMQQQQQQLARDAGGAAAAADPQEAYARATIAAEPELVSSTVGLPPASRQDDGDGAAQGDAGEGASGRKAAAVSEEDERRRKEMDERELIMDRLVEEERAQEDAYNRVALLRNRVQQLKQKRDLAKAKGKKSDA